VPTHCGLVTATVCGPRGRVDSPERTMRSANVYRLRARNFGAPDRQDLRLRDDHHWTWIWGLTFETLKTVMSQESPLLSRNYLLRDVEESP
jgi:hypothetical protein